MDVRAIGSIEDRTLWFPSSARVASLSSLPSKDAPMKRWPVLSILVAQALGLGGCAGLRPPDAAFTLSSPDFAPGTSLPDRTVLDGLDCRGGNVSPALSWDRVPDGTRSFVLVLDDYEARGGDGFVHWVAYDIPAAARGVAANAGARAGDLPGGGTQAYNDFLERSYGGPCPPEGAPHRYRFTVYALDLPAIDDAGTPMTWRKLCFIIRGHVLAQASLTGLRGHD